MEPQRVPRIYRALELNLRIKSKKRLVVAGCHEPRYLSTGRSALASPSGPPPGGTRQSTLRASPAVTRNVTLPGNWITEPVVVITPQGSVSVYMLTVLEEKGEMVHKK